MFSSSLKSWLGGMVNNPTTGQLSHTKLWANIAGATMTYKFASVTDAPEWLWFAHGSMVGGYALIKRGIAAIPQLADIQRDHGEQRLRMEQQHRAAEQHWQQFSQTQTAELVKAQQEIDRRADHIQQKNHHAIQQDKYHRDYNDVGANSLRQYNRAFGYAD